MILCDVNVLIYAFRDDSDRHPEYAEWLNAQTADNEPIGVSDHVLSSFIRVVTNRRTYPRPSRPELAFEFAEALRGLPVAVRLQPGPRHWGIFARLCREAKAAGNLVPDAYFAALAMEHGCEWITTDRDYARFPGLRWRHPLDG